MQKKKWSGWIGWGLVLAALLVFMAFAGYQLRQHNLANNMSLAEETIACVDFAAAARNVEFFEERGFVLASEPDSLPVRLQYDGEATDMTIIIDAADSSRWNLVMDYGKVLCEQNKNPEKYDLYAAVRGENSRLTILHIADNPSDGVKEMDAIILQLFADLAAYEAAK